MAKHKTVDSFTDAVEGFVKKKAPEAATVFLRKVSLVAYGMLIRQSPVKAGYFRANWFPAVNQIPREFEPNRTSAPMAELPELKIGDKVVHGNNTPYAQRLEAGWSKQAPQGIVAVVKRRLENQLRAKRV